MSEHLSPALWGRAALLAGASLPVLSPSPPSLRSAVGPRARAAHLLWIPQAPSALPAGGTGVSPASFGGSQSPGCGTPWLTRWRQCASGRVEPRGAPHLRLPGPTLGTTPFPAPILPEAGLGVSRCQAPFYPTHSRAKEAWRMGSELALHSCGPDTAKSTLWPYPTTTLRGRGFFTPPDR